MGELKRPLGTRAVLASAVDNRVQYRPRKIPANTYFIVVAGDAGGILWDIFGQRRPARDALRGPLWKGLSCSLGALWLSIVCKVPLVCCTLFRGVQRSIDVLEHNACHVPDDRHLGRHVCHVLRHASGPWLAVLDKPSVR